jgi:uncharacterized membrane protein
MKNKNFVSLSMALTFTSLSITGLLLYLVRHNKTTTSIHVVFGLLFLAFAIFHIINNWSSLASYTKSKSAGSFQKEFILSFAVVAIFLAGTWLNIPPFGEIEPLGDTIRSMGGGERKREARVMFLEIEGKPKNGVEASIIIQKDRKATLPVMAIWVEDSTHTFVENLFVPAKTMAVEKGEEDIQEAIREGEVEVRELDASLLPTWKSKAKDQHATYDEYTPDDDFILKTKISVTGVYSIFIEVKAGDTTELYEASIDLAKEKVFSFKSKEGSILTRAIVELR